MTLLAPFDPTTESDIAPLLRRLGIACAGLLACSSVVAWGGPGTKAARAPTALGGVAVSSAVADTLPEAVPEALPDAPFGATSGRGPGHRWSSVLGFGAPVALGDFDDLTLRPTDAAPDDVPDGIADGIADAAADDVPDRAPGAEVFTVVIDPGHGGSDPGAVASNGLLEKELTADIAARARRFLSELDGIEVVLTREGDVGLSRAARVARVRAAGADLVVSLHFNHLPQTDITLVESYYAAAENVAESRALRRSAAAGRAGGLVAAGGRDEPDLGFTEGSARLARLVQRRVFGEVAHHNPDATDAGVKRDTLFVLTRSEVPGALVELTCLSNLAEAERLEGDAYRNRLAAALADAVRDYRASLRARPLGATGA